MDLGLDICCRVFSINIIAVRDGRLLLRLQVTLHSALLLNKTSFSLCTGCFLDLDIFHVRAECMWNAHAQKLIIHVQIIRIREFTLQLLCSVRCEE